MKLGRLLQSFHLCCGAIACNCGKKEKAGYNPPPVGVKRPDKPPPAPPAKTYDKRGLLKELL